MSGNVSRKSFLAGASAVSGLLGIAVLSGCSESTPVSGSGDSGSDLIDTYEYDYDECAVDNVCQFCVLSGSWEDMGRQYGQQAKGVLTRQISKSLADAIDLRGDINAAYDELDAYESMLEEVFPEYLDYLHGISEETGFPYNDVLLAHITLDPTGSQDQVEEEDSHNCSDVAAWGAATLDNHTLAAINSDGNRDNFQTPVTLFYPESGGSILLAGGNCALNDSGLLVMATQGQANRADDSGFGFPVVLDCLYLALKCKNGNDAKDSYLSDCTPFSGENCMVIDLEGNNYVIEATNSHSAVRQSGDHGEQNYLIANNHFITDDMQDSVFPSGSGYDDCPYRYATVEKHLCDNMGRITVDVLENAESDSRYYDPETEQWIYDWNPTTGLYSPLNKDFHYGAYMQRVIDLDTRTAWVLDGSSDPLLSFSPEALGTYARVSLLESPREVVEDLIFNAELEMWNAERDQDSEPNEGGLEFISVAREQYVVGQNYYDQARIASDASVANAMWAKALSAYGKSMCYSKAAQHDPTLLVVDAS